MFPVSQDIVLLLDTITLSVVFNISVASRDCEAYFQPRVVAT